MEVDPIVERFGRAMRALRMIMTRREGFILQHRAASEVPFNLPEEMRAAGFPLPEHSNPSDPKRKFYIRLDTEAELILRQRVKNEVEAEYGIHIDKLADMHWASDSRNFDIVLDLVGILLPLKAPEAVKCIQAILCKRPVSAEEFKAEMVALFGQVKGPCQKQWNAGEHAYRCRTCQQFPTTAICEECFHSGNHSTHDYTIYVSGSGGSCDCGTIEAMHEEGFCPSHRIEKERSPTSLHPKMPKRFIKIISALVDHTIVVPQLNPLSGPDVFCAASVLRELVMCRPEFRRVLCHVLARGKDPDRFMKLMEILAIANYPSDLLHLIVSLGVESGYKAEFIRAYVRCIPTFLHVFIHSDSPEACELLSQKHLQLSVQAFACSEKVSDVLIECKAGQQLLQSIMSVLDRGKRRRLAVGAGPASTDLAAFVCNHLDPVIKRHVLWTISLDFHNLVGSSSKQFTSLMADPTSCLLWLDILGLLEGMNKYQRKEGLHVMYDSMTWHPAVHLEVGCFLYPLASLDKWVALATGADVTPALENVLRLGAQRLRAILSQEEPFSPSGKLSLHLPLHRTLSICSSYYLRHHSIDEFAQLVSAEDLKAFLDSPLRVFSVKAQARVGMWVRNGMSFITHLAHFCGFRESFFFIDADVHMCQLALLLVPHGDILTALTGHFLLDNWLEGRPDAVPISDLDTKRRVGILEDFLMLLISLFTNRSWMGSSLLENSKKKAIALLSQSPMPHSKLVERLGSARSEEESFDFNPVLQAVADFEPPSTTRMQGLFRLKPSMWSEYDPSFLAVHGVDRSALQSAQEQYATVHHLKEGDAPKAVRVSFMDFPPLPEAYKGLFGLLQSRHLHRVLALVLARMVDLTGSPEFSPTVVQAVLHLVRMALLHAPAQAPAEKEAAVEAAGEVYRADHIATNVAQPIVLPCSAVKPEAGAAATAANAATATTEATAEAATTAPTTTTLLELIMRFRGREDVADQAYLETLLQLCRKSADVDHMIDELSVCSPSSDAQAKARAAKRQKAQDRQKAIMQKFQKQQMKFLDTAAESLSESMSEELSSVPSAASAAAAPMDEGVRECVICLRECTAGKGSHVLCHSYSHITTYASSQQQFSWLPTSANNEFQRKVHSMDATTGSLIKSCGHWVHLECLTPYLQSQRPEQTVFRDIRYLLPKEFLCPMCRSVCNTHFPLAIRDDEVCKSLAQAWTFKPAMEGELVTFLRECAVQAKRAPGFLEGSSEDAYFHRINSSRAFVLAMYGDNFEPTFSPQVHFGEVATLDKFACEDDGFFRCFGADANIPLRSVTALESNIKAESLAAQFGARKSHASAFVNKFMHTLINMELKDDHKQLLSHYAKSLVAPDKSSSRQLWMKDTLSHMLRLIALMPKAVVERVLPEIIQLCNALLITQVVGSVICDPASPALSHMSDNVLDAHMVLRKMETMSAEAVSRTDDSCKWTFGLVPCSERVFMIRLDRACSPTDSVECIVDVLVSFSGEENFFYPAVDGDSVDFSNQPEQTHTMHFRRIRFPPGQNSNLNVGLVSFPEAFDPNFLDLVCLKSVQCVVLRHIDNFSRPADSEDVLSLRRIADGFLAVTNACTDEVQKSDALSVRILDDDVWSLVSGPLTREVHAVSLQFLRRAAILAEALGGVHLDDDLRVYDYTTLARLLKLVPDTHEGDVTPEDALRHSGLVGLIPEWLGTLQMLLNGSITTLPGVRLCVDASIVLAYEPPGTRTPLISLPRLYDELLCKYRTAACCVCAQHSESLSLCLLCGSITCFSTQERSCVRRHASECCKQFGLCLAFYQSSVLVTTADKFLGIWGSPYLDDYGEEDLGLRRGKRLVLNEERYKRLQAAWLTGNLEYECK